LTRRLLLAAGGGGFAVTLPTGAVAVGAISTITDNAKYNAWPAVARMANGSLLVVYASGNSHNADNTSNVAGKISSDEGATWGTEFTVADETLGAINPGICTLASGRVLVTYNLFNFPNSIPDAIRVRYSDDNGSTWSSAYTVNSTFTDWTANGGRPAQLGGGTVLLTLYGMDTTDTFASTHLFTSSDDGATFGSESTLADGDTDSRHYYEPALLLLNTGDVLCLMRTTGGTGNTYQKRSTDSGATWSAAAIAFAGYSTPHAIQTTVGTLIAGVRGNAAAQVEAFTSINSGTTWTSQGDIDATMFEMEYACPVELLDGRVLMVYGSQPTSSTTNSDIKQAYLTLS
jgi:Neuraminidase (sialidase)